MLSRSAEQIKKDMLNSIDDGKDKTPNHFIDNTLAAVSLEFANLDLELRSVAMLLKVDNLYKDDLDMYVADHSPLIRKEGTKASGYVNFIGSDGTVIPVGSLVTTGEVNYELLEEVKLIDKTGIGLVECVEVGAVGNIPANAIYTFPVSLQGVTEVINEMPFINGFDEEDDDTFRNRFKDFIKDPPTSGNPAHYRMWAKEVIGVGEANCLTNRDTEDIQQGDVKVLIMDSNFKPATDKLCMEVWENIEIVRPVGANVEVVSGKGLDITISAKVKLARGYKIDEVIEEYKHELEKYREDVAFKDSYLSYAKIGRILLDTSGVLDYEDLLVSNDNKNIGIEAGEIPIFTNILIEVI